jgi:hypothetical protein
MDRHMLQRPPFEPAGARSSTDAGDRGAPPARADRTIVRPRCRAGGAVAAAMVAAACSDTTTTFCCADPVAEPTRLTWPLPGVALKDWVINNYVDLDPTSGLRDYRGGAKVYDGHNGTDIDVPNFRWMDADFPVVAAAAGTVTRLQDGEYDRNTSCTGQWNFVEVTHGDGTRAWYGHLKKGSLLVAIGAVVGVGQRLGVVGSSGCSTQPHLHFELRSATGAVIDPFEQGLWLDPPAYDPPLGFMDLLLKEGAITGVDELKDPPANMTTAALGSTLGIGLSMGGGGPGDVIRVTLEDADHVVQREMSVTYDRVRRHSYWYFNRSSVTGAPGGWKVKVFVNASVVADYPFTLQ